jgi:VanZ family protein
LKYQFPPILWLVLIYGLSSISKFPTLKTPIGFDKIVHAVLWFVLCAFTRRAFFFQERYQWLKAHALLVAFLFAVIYGASDEFHQQFVPSRTPDVYDAVADTVGALLFVVIFWIWKRNRRPQPEPAKESLT